MPDFSRVMDGATAVLDVPPHVPAVVGALHDPTKVLWAFGEALMLAGPTGCGKSTLLQQIALRRASVGALELFDDLIVVPDTRGVLYLALDRPSQIRRSMRRMVRELDRRTLADRLHVWPGPLPFDLLATPTGLRDMAIAVGVGTVIVDSVKDMVPAVSKDEVASALNIAFQHVLAAGIELAVAHHTRKVDAERKRRTVDDVYGSTWLTAGMGSVLLLEGAPGDPVVRATHVKQPAETCGPWDLEHDHVAGRTTTVGAVDLAELVTSRPDGITTAQAAEAIFGKADRNTKQKAARQLRRLKEEGTIVEEAAPNNGPTRWTGVHSRAPRRAPDSSSARQGTIPLVERARPVHAGAHPIGGPASPPPVGGEADAVHHPTLLDQLGSEDAVIAAFRVAFDATEVTADGTPIVTSPTQVGAA